MKLPFSDRKKFILYAINQHLGLLGIGLAFFLFGSLFIYIGMRNNNEIGFIIFGGLFILFPCAFLLYTLPSSLVYYYEQALTKKYGTYTTAKITNKRVDDYSYSTSSFNGGRSKKVEEFLYVIEFEFTYNNTVYKSECFFEEQTTFEIINLETPLPIQFLKTNPNKIKVRRRKLSNELGIKSNLCN